MKTRLLRDLEVSELGFGCMGMSHAYGGMDEVQAIQTLRRVQELGINFFDTAEVYGPYDNERLLGKALAPIRNQVKIATKFGFEIDPTKRDIDAVTGLNSQPQHIRKVVEQSLQRLQTDRIDLLYQHRLDPNVPIEETVGVMADLVKEGKVLHLGLCEVNAQIIQKAHSVHPISAVQSEYSLWFREPEQEILPLIQALNIGFVPFSPLGRGWLTSQLNVKELSDTDYRRQLPRFQAENLQQNQILLDQFNSFAQQKQVTPAQIALAWLRCKSTHIVAIPGARREAHIKDNIASSDVELTAAEILFLDELFSPEKVQGERYPSVHLEMVK